MPCHRIRAVTVAVDHGCRTAARSSADLVAGTANINLSERMVSGDTSADTSS